jgi:hypothetical protein
MRIGYHAIDEYVNVVCITRNLRCDFWLLRHFIDHCEDLNLDDWPMF